MGKQVNVLQGTQDWLEFRRGHIGASDAPVVMDVSPWMTPMKLWEQKVGLTGEPYQTDRMKRGHGLEEVARYIFERDTGITVMPLTYVHDSLEWMSASFDGMSLDEKTLVEIKCPNPLDHTLALNGKVPEKYYPQLQHQMEVAGVDEMHYMSYENDGCYAIFKVARDDSYIKGMLDKEKEFWSCVSEFRMPSDGYKDMSMSEEWGANESEYAVICDRIADLEVKKEALRKRLIDSCEGSNCKGRVLKMTRVVSKGRVKYDQIPQLEDIDLEKYRAKPSESYRFERLNNGR